MTSIPSRLSTVAGIIALATVAAYAQGTVAGVSPDGKGDRIRGAAPPPVNQTSQTSVTTGNGINYNGGPVLHTVNVYYIWYGNWSQDPAANAILTAYAQNVGGSPYFNIETTYGDPTGNVPNAVTYKGSYSDAGSLGTSLTDSSIWPIVTNAITFGFGGKPDSNGVYFVLTAPGVQETSGFLTKFCGWHSYSVDSGTGIQYAFVGDAAGNSLGSCAAQTGSSPNNDPPADAMVSVIAHELEEAASDPQLNAWYDSSGEENADKCAWTFGTTYNAGNGSAANMALGGLNFLIQQNWVNALGGYCALSYAAGPDFTVSATPPSQTVVPGSSTSYTVNVGAQNGYTGNVALSVSGLPAGTTSNFSTNPVIGGSGSSSLNVFPTSNTVGGTSTLTIQGTDGTLTHTTPVTLKVADFSISASPTIRSVPQGTNTTYTVTIGALGGFSSSVALAVSGLPVGATASFSPTSINGSGNSTMTVTTGSAAAGAYGVTIKGTALSGQVHTFGVSLSITAADFTISATPASQSAGTGTSGIKYSVTIGAVGGFSSPVALSLTGLPTGASASFSPTSVTGSGTSTLTLNAGTAVVGTYPMTVTGTFGSLIHSFPVSLTLTASDFTLTPSNSSPSTKQGTGVATTVTIGATGGFTGIVALSVTGLPTGLTASFNPTSITKSGNSTLTLTPNGTPAGTYPLTVKGTSGTLSHTAALSLTVTLGGSINVSASPNKISVSRSGTGSVKTVVTVSSSNGFAGAVNLAATALPANATASFSPSTVNVTPGTDGTSTMTITVSPTTPTGRSSVDVAGNSGSGGPQGTGKITLSVGN